MTTFVGTFKEFNTYLNDYVKNKVPVLTRKYRNCMCELCQSKKAIDSAHKHSRERGILILEAFNVATTKQTGNIHHVDLATFAAHIKKLHSDPNNFHFLCHECHLAYDAEGSTILESDFHRMAPKHPVSKARTASKPGSFEDYLSTTLGLRPRTVKAYAITAPNTILNNFKIDIYLEKDPLQVLHILEKLKGNSTFFDLDEKGNHMYSCSLKQYAQYLETIAH